MPAKSVPFSVRLSPDDAEFLAALEVPGAITPSDKIRSIITEARVRSTPASDLAELTRRFEDEFRPADERIKEMEREADQESELMDFVSGWLARTCAEFAAGPHSIEDLTRFEAKIARQVTKLTEQMLRMAISSDAACYDPSVISSNMQRAIEIAGFIRTQNKGDVPNA